MKRSFRAFADKEDLQTIFGLYQNALNIYYVPTYSDAGPVTATDITIIPDIGKNFYGSHIGNNQFLVFFKETPCVWRNYECHLDEKTTVTRYTTLCDENVAAINIDLGGIYEETNIFPTEIDTLYYENEKVKKLYDELRKVFRKNSVMTKNGYFICKKAYENKESYRFCTIDIKSPREYDLIVE